MAEDELAAFDAIAGEVNDTRRALLFGKYTLKTKAYIINKMKLESEKLIKENEKASENLENMRKIIQSKNNSKCLQKATMQSSNCEIKKNLLLLRLRKEKLQKKNKDIKQMYTQKWCEYEKVYESTSLAQQRRELKTEIDLKNFLVKKAKYEKLHWKQALFKKQAIAKIQEQHAIVTFANYMVSRSQMLEMISKKRIHLQAMLNEIDELTKQRRSIRAQLEDMTLSRNLRMIQTPIFIQKRQHIMDDLPNMENFLDTIHSTIPKLEMPKLSQPVGEYHVVTVSHQSKMKKEMCKPKPSSFYDNNNEQDNNVNKNSCSTFCDPFDTKFAPKARDNYKQEHKEQDSIIKHDQESYEVSQDPVNINDDGNTIDVNTLVETEPVVSDQRDEEKNVSSENNDSKKITIIENRVLSQETSSTLVYDTLKKSNLREVRYLGLNDNIEIVIGQSCPDLNSNQHDQVNEVTEHDNTELGESQCDKSKVDINASCDIVLPPTEYKDKQCETNTEVPLTTEPLTLVTTLASQLPFTTSLVESDTSAGHDDSFSPLSGPGADLSLNMSRGSQLTNISCASLVSTESYRELKEKLLQKYQLDISPNFVYAKNTKVQPKVSDEQSSKYFPKTEHKDFPLNVLTENKELDIPNVAPTSMNEPQNETESKGDDTEKAHEERQEMKKPIEEFHTLTFSSGMQPHLSMSCDTQLKDLDEDSITDFTNLLTTPADMLLSPTYKEPEPDTQEAAKEPPQSSSSFFFGLGNRKKTAFGMFGNNSSSSKESQDSGSNNPQQNDLSFNFGTSPETKRKRSGLFSLFNN